METEYLREFLTLAENGSFSETADKHYISESALSRHILALESSLGTTLFVRGRKSELSQFGKLFLPYAKDIVEKQDEFQRALAFRLRSEKNRLVIGCIPAIAPYNVLPSIAQFQKQNPQFSISVKTDISENLRMGVMQNKYDAAIIFEIHESGDDFHRIYCDTDNVVAALPANHPLASKESVSLSELRGERFLMIQNRGSHFDDWHPYFKEAGYMPKIILTSRSTDSILDLVKSGMGISLMMRKTILHRNDPELVPVDIVPRIKAGINIIFKNGILRTTSAECFLHHFKTHYE